MAKSNKGLLYNLSWKFAERISAQLITTLVSIILARMLEPSYYGIVSIVTIFITLANVFVSDGFGSALIQKKDADSLDYSSVLYFTSAMSILMYLILFFSAPYIAAFYGEGYELLSPVLRVLGLRLILSAINSVQQAYVSKKMIFKKFFYATMCGTVASAAVGIAMAYAGYGVWALVAQYLTNTTVNTIVLRLSLDIKFPFKVSFKRLGSLMSYGWKILGSALLISGYQELRAMIIGKVYSSADLAFYDKGKQFPNLVVTNINSSISAVLFPKMSNEQDDISKIKEITRRSIRFSAYIMSPMMLGLLSVARPFVKLVLTDKWLPCVPLLQIFCIIYLFQPIHSANLQAIKAIGRSDVFLKLEIIKKSLELITLIAVMNISVEAIALSAAILTTLYTFVNAYPNKKLLNYAFGEQMLDILPALFMSVVMAITVFPLSLLGLGELPLMCLQIIGGIFVYLILSLITKNKEFLYIVSIIKSKIHKNAA